MTGQTPCILGLDIGAASIGWALIDADPQGRPTRLRAAGVHLFEAGVEGGKLDPETALTRGLEQSRAKPRRDARALRRQTWRRARRKKKVLAALIRSRLLPEGDIRTPAAIDAYLKSLDARLRARWEPEGTSHADRQKLPYRLRAAAAVRPVEPDELARALYHLAQRRGFLSNRKAPERDEDRSKMKKAIGELAGMIADHDPPTLGAYLCSLDPDDERLRARWTARTMYEHEFDRIWQTQAEHHALSEEARKQIHDAIFHQRPLKDQRHLIGRCSLTAEPRCPLALRIAQRFRVLQQVNHLRLITDDLAERPLSSDERRRLIDALCRQGDLTIAEAKKAAGLPSRGSGAVTFSIERGGETNLVGHRTDAKLRAIFGDRWDELTEAERDRVVEDVRSVRLPDTLEGIGRNRWNLTPEAAEQFADLTLEEGHSAHSRTALEKLVPRMDHDALSYSEARKLEFPDSFSSQNPRDTLPPLQGTHRRGDPGVWDRDLRNPSVTRALTELRHLVNALIRRHGKPLRIHVELARDLKAPRSRREKIAKRMRDRETERSEAAEAITRELGYPDPRPWQIQKWLLAEECGWRCPFTGREFGARELLGSNPQFDVEHIWPLSKSLDNAFLNKTICYHEENRNRKCGHTPNQAYAGTPKRYEAILDRVRAFRGDPFVVREKLRRFTDDIDDDFTNRHLAETRYIARLACDYLALLYGGRVENLGQEGSARRIITPSGGLVAQLRRGWGLSAILSDRDEKERNDHRHHAVDAVVIALADQRAIQRLAEAATRMEREGRERPFDRLDPPWDGFIDDARHAISAVTVSHRQSRKLRGKLHKDTLYSREHDGKRRVSKELWKLTKKNVKKGEIVDKRALKAITARLDQLGETNPQKAFQEPANRPLVSGPAGRMLPLRRVRVEVGGSFRRFGSGARERYAPSKSNHHMAFYDRPVPGGGVHRIAEVVSLAEATLRLRRGEPVVDRSPRDPHTFAFSLAPDEYVLFDDGVPHERLCRVLSISDNDLELIAHFDGRPAGERKKKKERIRLTKGKIDRAHFRKVHVNYLGEVRNAGG